jgi:hypothetical protein
MNNNVPPNFDRFREPQKAPTDKSDAQNQISSFARVPGYLDSDSADSKGVIDRDGKQLGATVLLPAITLDLPMNHRGEPIDYEVEDPIFGWGYPEPCSDNLSAAANESRKVTVKVSVKIHGWEFGWPEEMQPESKASADLASSAENQLVAKDTN